MRYFEIEIQNAHLTMSEKEIELHRERNNGKIDYKVLSEFTNDEIGKCGFDNAPSLETEEKLAEAIRYYQTGKK